MEKPKFGGTSPYDGCNGNRGGRRRRQKKEGKASTQLIGYLRKQRRISIKA